MYVYSVYIHIFILNYILYLYDNMIIYDNPQIFWILIKSAPGPRALKASLQAAARGIDLGVTVEIDLFPALKQEMNGKNMGISQEYRIS